MDMLVAGKMAAVVAGIGPLPKGYCSSHDMEAEEEKLEAKEEVEEEYRGKHKLWVWMRQDSALSRTAA